MNDHELSKGAASTAMCRPSTAIAAGLLRSDLLTEWGIARILDFGCGWADDAKVYEQPGVQAFRYDRDPRFGHDVRPQGFFDLVTMNYVVNVLPTRQGRIDAIRDAASFLGPAGRLLVVSRPKAVINREARARNWQPHNDGYVSNTSKRTFQRGHTKDELQELVVEAGLTPIGESRLRLPHPSWTLAVRRSNQK